VSSIVRIILSIPVVSIFVAWWVYSYHHCGTGQLFSGLGDTPIEMLFWVEELPKKKRPFCDSLFLLFEVINASVKTVTNVEFGKSRLQLNAGLFRFPLLLLEYIVSKRKCMATEPHF